MEHAPVTRAYPEYIWRVGTRLSVPGSSFSAENFRRARSRNLWRSSLYRDAYREISSTLVYTCSPTPCRVCTSSSTRSCLVPSRLVPSPLALRNARIMPSLRIGDARCPGHADQRQRRRLNSPAELRNRVERVTGINVAANRRSRVLRPRILVSYETSTEMQTPTRPP